MPNPLAGDRARIVVDLGCGDGRETLALLASGWTVVAIDGAPEAIVRLRASVPPDEAERLTTFVGRFHEVALPDADFRRAVTADSASRPEREDADVRRFCRAL
jgi:predicted RNA methylase